MTLIFDFMQGIKLREDYAKVVRNKGEIRRRCMKRVVVNLEEYPVTNRITELRFFPLVSHQEQAIQLYPAADDSHNLST